MVLGGFCKIGGIFVVGVASLFGPYDKSLDMFLVAGEQRFCPGESLWGLGQQPRGPNLG